MIHDNSGLPYPVTEKSEHPRATVRPTVDGRWRVMIWERPGQLRSNYSSNEDTTWLKRFDALVWAERQIQWDRKLTRHYTGNHSAGRAPALAGSGKGS